MKIFTRARKNHRFEDISEWACPLWDFHTHILPGVDDGSPSLEVSLKMLEEEKKQGITDVLLTPHYFSGRSDWDKLNDRYERFKAAVEEEGLDITLHMGAELHYTAALSDELKKNDVSLEHSKYVLIEFTTDISYTYLKHAIRDVISAGRKPILAHVERYDCLMEKEERLNEVGKMGALMQINANTLADKAGEKMFIPLLESGLIQFVGSDCHTMEWRPPNMSKAIGVMANRLGREKTEEILNAGWILE